MADKLALYNDALAHLGERRLASLTENREPRRVLDDLWLPQVRWCLEQGPWTFSIRSGALAPDETLTPTFGYRNAFHRPADWLKTVDISRDERFQNAITRYVDEGGYWYSDEPVLFLRFVSTLDEFGMNLDRWSPSFVELVSARLAERACKRITGSSSGVADLVALRKAAMKETRANDAMNTPPVFPPVGDWVRSRWGGAGRRGRGNDGGTSFGGGELYVPPPIIPVPGGLSTAGLAGSDTALAGDDTALAGDDGLSTGIPVPAPVPPRRLPYPFPADGSTTLSGSSDLPANTDFLPRT